MHTFSNIKNHVLQQLRHSLPPFLTYHNSAHTLDVLDQAMVIAHESNITSPEDILLLKTGALYHDTGFMFTYNGHEEKSCAIAEQELPAYGFSTAQIKKIGSMIMATKIPQNPTTHLEEIICDADLDYLGRPDFYTIGEGLYKEFLHQKIVANELQWNQLQVRFLENHTYFTQACRQKREALKQQHLQEIKQKVSLLS